MKRTNAFTLMELIIVVIILGVLSSVAIPNYFKTVMKAKQRNALSQLQSIRTANLLYKGRHGYFYMGGGATIQDGTDTLSAPLGINVSAQGLRYDYSYPFTTDAANGFIVQVYPPGEAANAGNSRYYNIQMSNVPLTDPNSPPVCANPCCKLGNCASLGNCCF